MDAFLGFISLLLSVGLVIIFIIRPEILSAIGTWVLNAITFVGKIVSFAPRWMQILLFLCVGGAVIGFAVSGALSTQYTCVGSDMYEGESAAATATANLLPDAVYGEEDDVEWLGNTFFIFMSLFSGSKDASSLVNGVSTYGTYLGDSLYFERYSGDKLGLVMAVEVDEVEDVENTYPLCVEGDVLCSSQIRVFEQSENVFIYDAYICKNEDVGCYMSSSSSCFFDTQIAQIEYSFYVQDDSSVKANVEFYVSTEWVLGDNRNMTEECLEGDQKLWLEDANGEGGYVTAGYALLDRYEDLVEGGAQTVRAQYVSSAVEGKFVLVESSSDKFVEYSCVDSSPTFTVGGIDIFKWETMVILVVFVAFMQFLSYIKKW